MGASADLAYLAYLTPSPRGPSGRGAARKPAAARERRLLRLRADVQHAVAEIAAVRVETKLLLTLQAQRPVTPEMERVRVLSREGARLWFQLQRLRTEFEALQRSG